jgi:hypothetical protein
MIDVRINNQGLSDLLAAPPRIDDQLNAVCRTLEVTVKNEGVKNAIGQPIELWYNGKLHFEGRVFKRKFTAKGDISYKAYDPLIYFKNKNDWYVKNQTATQYIKTIAKTWGIKTGSIANTGVVFKALYYHAAEGDKVAIDLLARTYNGNRKKYWFRYVPGSGLTVFERKVPKELWAFQAGVNLLDASYEDSIEEVATMVKLVNRETGKIVQKINNAAYTAYGPLMHFEEVDKDQAKTMDSKAQQLLDKLSKVKISMGFEGINPDGVMPMFYSGDLVYVEEKHTRLIGAYYLENVSQLYVSDDLVEIGASVTKAANVAAIQYDDATEKPE